MTSQPEPHLAPTARPGSLWTSVAIASALVVWLGGLLTATVGALAFPAAILGLVAATIAVIRDQRTAWRVGAALAGLLSLAGAGTYAAIAVTLTV